MSLSVNGNAELRPSLRRSAGLFRGWRVAGGGWRVAGGGLKSLKVLPSVDGFRRERLQRFETFDLLSVQRSLETR